MYVYMFLWPYPSARLEELVVRTLTNENTLDILGEPVAILNEDIRILDTEEGNQYGPGRSFEKKINQRL